jgi:hypothetical protein
MKREHFVNIWLKLLFIIGLFLYQSGRVEAAPGDLDSTFGWGGRVITQNGIDEKAYAAALPADGKIVVVGYISDGTNVYDYVGVPTFDG